MIVKNDNRKGSRPEASADTGGRPQFESVSEFEGDDVSGGNMAYGNSPRTSGGRFTPVYPKRREER